MNQDFFHSSHKIIKQVKVQLMIFLIFDQAFFCLDLCHFWRPFKAQISTSAGSQISAFFQDTI